jgi:hypothetical protein
VATVNQSDKPGIWDKRRNVWRLLAVFFVCCAALLLADLVVHRHLEHAMESLFGFYAVYGFVACVILVLAAKQLRKMVMRDEDHYD